MLRHAISTTDYDYTARSTMYQIVRYAPPCHFDSVVCKYYAPPCNSGHYTDFFHAVVNPIQHASPCHFNNCIRRLRQQAPHATVAIGNPRHHAPIATNPFHAVVTSRPQAPGLHHVMPTNGIEERDNILAIPFQLCLSNTPSHKTCHIQTSETGPLPCVLQPPSCTPQLPPHISNPKLRTAALSTSGTPLQLFTTALTPISLLLVTYQS